MGNSRMIFGFNTDVKHGETVYHVQSEARAGDLLVQTLVFVKGFCVGKRTTSYAQDASEPGFSDDAVHKLLKAQHRDMVDAINGGKIESVLGASNDARETGGSGLSLQWIKSEPISTQDSVTMNFQVTDNGKAIEGADVISRLEGNNDAPPIARGATDGSGNIAMRIQLTDELRQEAAIIVKATHGGRSATRKFRLRIKDQ